MTQANDLAERLETCLSLIEAGMPVDECLARYPDAEEALRPLLSASAAVQTSLAAELPLASRLRMTSRVMSAWDERAARPSRRWWQFSLPTLAPKWAAVAASLAIVLVGGTGTVSASSTSVPGDALYPVKEFTEEARLWLTRSPEEKVAYYSDLVKERVRELTEITQAGDYRQSGIAVARLAEHLDDIDTLADADSAANLTTQLAEAAFVQRDALLDVQGLLENAPVDARAELSEAVDLLQEARDRVDSALESLRQ